MAQWKQVDVQGRLHSITSGDRAGRVEKDGGHYDAKIGRRRTHPETGARYWTWKSIGWHPTVEQAKAAVEEQLPQLVAD